MRGGLHALMALSVDQLLHRAHTHLGVVVEANEAGQRCPYCGVELPLALTLHTRIPEAELPLLPQPNCRCVAEVAEPPAYTDEEESNG